MKFHEKLPFSYSRQLFQPRLDLKALNETAWANGTDPIIMQATVIDIFTGEPIENVLVSFNLSYGNAFFIGTPAYNQKRAYTDNYGMAYANVYNYVPEAVTVIAYYEYSSNPLLAFIEFLPVSLALPSHIYAKR